MEFCGDAGYGAVGVDSCVSFVCGFPSGGEISEGIGLIYGPKF